MILILSSYAETQKESPIFTGNDWARLTKQEKTETIAAFITAAKKNGVTIKNLPAFYVSQLDAFYKKHPDLMNEKLGNVLKTLIVMEYDWEVKGLTKDTIAREWLGEALYNKNKARMKQKGN